MSAALLQVQAAVTQVRDQPRSTKIGPVCEGEEEKGRLTIWLSR